MNLADYKNIWVFIETECGKPKNVGFELINAAKPLAQEKGCELIAVVIGKDIEGVAKDAICYGADSAIIVDGPEYVSGLFGLRPPTADFGTTFGLALITFVMIEYAWIKTKGFGIIKDLLDPFPIFLPINIISEFATPVSMSLRLFGNVTAGTIMLGLWYALMPWFAKIGIPAFLHAYFDFFSGAIQTYVFGMLTMVFVANRYE